MSEYVVSDQQKVFCGKSPTWAERRRSCKLGVKGQGVALCSRRTIATFGGVVVWRFGDRLTPAGGSSALLSRCSAGTRGDVRCPARRRCQVRESLHKTSGFARSKQNWAERSAADIESFPTSVLNNLHHINSPRVLYARFIKETAQYGPWKQPHTAAETELTASSSASIYTDRGKYSIHNTFLLLFFLKAPI